MKFELTYKVFGESAVLIEWPSKMEEPILDDVIMFNETILKAQIPEINEIIQSINSLTVVFDNGTINHDELVASLKKIRKGKSILQHSPRTSWKIPVCYDETFGLDLAELSAQKGLSKDEIVDIHSQQKYKVYAIGFLPGFLYLGGLDKRLYSPRRAQPRLEIMKGSVGIGGEQTGIYPSASPGGWQIIGNTPVTLFDVNKDIPCFAKPGDKIRFTPISLTDHNLITQLISVNEYKLEKEVIDD